MLRSLLAAIVFGLYGSTVTLAAQSCEDWCERQCAHRILSQAVCMNKCIAACRHKRRQDRHVKALPQYLRQLGNIRRDPPRLVARAIWLSQKPNQGGPT